MKKESVFWVYSGRAILVFMLAFTLSFCGHSSKSSSTPSYTSATLYIYFCPNFYNEGCSSGSMLINSVCYSFTAIAGACNNTGYTLNANTIYSFQHCPTLNCTSCSSPFTFTTPKSFSKQTYYAGSWLCQNSCNAPSDCP